jgi:hypothetical protein
MFLHGIGIQDTILQGLCVNLHVILNDDDWDSGIDFKEKLVGRSHNSKF